MKYIHKYRSSSFGEKIAIQLESGVNRRPKWYTSDGIN